MINVLIVDDSAVAREFLMHTINSEPEFEVVGMAANGEAAIKRVKELKPDVVIMDIFMPIMNGFVATQKIMEKNPVPIIITSASYDISDTEKSYKALEAGALVIVKKPLGEKKPGSEKEIRELKKFVRLMSEIKVATRWRGANIQAPSNTFTKEENGRQSASIKLIAIGASTGGPAVIEKIFTEIPKDIPVPIVVVQHMAEGFMDSFVTWLGNKTGMPIKIAQHGELLLPGHAYFAPDKYHMEVGINDRIVLSNDEMTYGLKPSVANLFKSVSEHYGFQAAGVLLTGMGVDGARELKLIKESGGITIAQNEESSIVFGMPGEAIRIKAVDYILNPNGIVDLLTQLVKDK